MATMKRNDNLEEIAKDSFLGISFLQHQTFMQKAIFVSSLVVAVAVIGIGIFVFNLSQNTTLFAAFVPIIFGVLFGANYNQDFPVYKFLIRLFTKPSTKLVSMPIEDLASLRLKRKELEIEAARKNNAAGGVSAEEYKKQLFIKLFIGFAVMIIAIIVIVAVKNNLSTGDLHHVVE